MTTGRDGAAARAEADTTSRTGTTEQELRRALDDTVLRLEELLDDAHGFVETVAHDLRAPLAAMSGFAELVAKDDSLPAVSQQLLHRIVLSARTASERVESVLQQARARAGELRDDVDVATCLDWVVDLLDPRAVTVRTTGPLPVVLANEQAVRQVLLNLVGNAATHGATGDQPVAVGVRARRLRDPDQGLWEIEVADDGPGLVSPDDVPAEESRGAHAAGLERTRRLVEQQGGTLSVRTGGPGPGGLTVRFTLPALP